MARFTVRIFPTPNGHWQALQDVTRGIAWALKQIGHEIGGSLSDSRLIAFNSHVAPTVPMPRDAIIYNSEQVPLDLDTPPQVIPVTHHTVWREWWKNYLDTLQRHIVWDYSEANAQRLKTYGVERVALCPVGYYPALTSMPHREAREAHHAPTTDIVFIGSVNERRREILRQLLQLTESIKTGFGVYGEERDALIADARIVLNIHYYDNPIWEIFRCSYLLANGCCVVSEGDGRDSTLETLARATTACVPYDKIVETCAELLKNELRRKQIAEQGAKIFKALDQADFVRTALDITETMK